MGKKTPDVIVVGMPSSGKTVFFTVLGKKFTNLLDGRRSAPLGFRMGTCDIDTSDVINVAYDRLRTGHWPEPTRTGQVMPLRWEVFTGGRRIFELSSMDVAGETFKRVFGIYDGDMERTKKNEKKNNTFGQKDNSDLGNELYRPDVTEGSITSTITTNITNEEDAAEILKDAIKNAKVVCFMINIALPEGANRRKSSDDDNMRFLRFRNSVVNMYLSLKEDSDLRAKSMIVLTQSYRYQGL